MVQRLHPPRLITQPSEWRFQTINGVVILDLLCFEKKHLGNGNGSKLFTFIYHMVSVRTTENETFLLIYGSTNPYAPCIV